MKNYYDCMVVGGGVAGSTAAYHLASLGYNVGVLEKSQAAHDKVCGEFLSFEALTYLSEMGLALDNDVPVVKHVKILLPHAQAGFTFPVGGRGVSRRRLDEDLLTNAGARGAYVHRGTCMRDYRKDKDGIFTIQTNKGDYHARHLFMATGKHDYAPAAKRSGRDNSYVALKAHVRLGDPGEAFKDTTVLFTFAGGYGGTCPVEPGVVSFCFIMKKALYRTFRGDFPEALAFLRRSNQGLDRLLREAAITGPISAVGHIPYGFLRSQNNQDGVFFAGDQRMVIPSFTGDGMAVALMTARHCAHAFHRRQRGLAAEGDAMQAMLRVQMRWALVGWTILKHSRLAQVCALIPGLGTFLIGGIFNQTRIPITEQGDYGKPKRLKDTYSRY